MCSPTLHVYFDVFLVTPTKRLAAPPSGYITTIILIWGLFANKVSQLFLHHNALFQLIQLFICGNSRYLLPKRWNWQICHTHQALKRPLRTLSGKLRTFPTVKSKTIGFLLYWTQQCTPVHFGKSPCELLPEKVQLSSHYAYFEIDGTCYINVNKKELRVKKWQQKETKQKQVQIWPGPLVESEAWLRVHSWSETPDTLNCWSKKGKK